MIQTTDDYSLKIMRVRRSDTKFFKCERKELPTQNYIPCESIPKTLCENSLKSVIETFPCWRLLQDTPACTAVFVLTFSPDCKLCAVCF